MSVKKAIKKFIWKYVYVSFNLTLGVIHIWFIINLKGKKHNYFYFDIMILGKHIIEFCIGEIEWVFSVIVFNKCLISIDRKIEENEDDCF